MMGGMAESSLGLEDGKGTSFYRFRDIQERVGFGFRVQGLGLRRVWI